MILFIYVHPGEPQGICLIIMKEADSFGLTNLQSWPVITLDLLYTMYFIKKYRQSQMSQNVLGIRKVVNTPSNDHILGSYSSEVGHKSAPV